MKIGNGRHFRREEPFCSRGAKINMHFSRAFHNLRYGSGIRYKTAITLCIKRLRLLLYIVRVRIYKTLQKICLRKVRLERFLNTHNLQTLQCNKLLEKAKISSFLLISRSLLYWLHLYSSRRFLMSDSQITSKLYARHGFNKLINGKQAAYGRPEMDEKLKQSSIANPQ